MAKSKPKKSEVTRERILDVALARFRERGFDRTSMREIADAAGLSLGAAYYYFPSKEAIVFAWYLRTQAEHDAEARRAFEAGGDLRQRLGAVMHGKLRIVERERKTLGALFRVVGDPDHELSLFSPHTRAVREQSIGIFASALDGTELPEDLRRMLGPALWMLHLGFLLYFIHDRSRKQERTVKLVDGTLDLLAPLIAVAARPEAAPLRGRLVALIADLV
jgi:AcrR family transcriptional regulator